MAVTRYVATAPWRELDQITNRLSRMFDGANGSFAQAAAGAWTPPVNVEETQDEVLLTAELPGMKPEAVEIEVENDVLTIRGEKLEERREEGQARRYHVWERHHGAFRRAFVLPRTVRAEDISAEFEHGLLRVRMPKVPEARSRRIEVRSGGAELGSGEVTSGQDASS